MANGHWHSNVRQLVSVFAFALTATSVLTFKAHFTLGQQQISPTANSLVNSDSINLKSILEHQAGLAQECEKYQKAKERELQSWLKFSADNELIQVNQANSIQVPAVCLLFLANNIDQHLASASSTPTQLKLDLVNWIVDASKSSALSNKSTTISKRQTTSEAFLSKYLLDPSFASVSDNEVDLSKIQSGQLSKDIGALVSNEQFASGMSLAKGKLASHLSPVILIPGLLGSRLQSKTQKTTKVNIFCSKQSDWQDMWLSLRMFFPIAIDCWLDNVRLELDPVTGYTRQPDGVQTRVADFGSVESVRHLDLRQPKLTSYYQPLIERYEKLGYTPNMNLLAAPYDFRLAPQQLTDFFSDLKSLVEMAMGESPSGKKVTLVCHSMGCTHALIFLRQQSAAWRQSRIRKLIALSSPWAGTTKALKALVVGDQLDLPLVSESKMRILARTYPSIAHLMPQAELFAQANKNQVNGGGPILVQTPQREYRVADLERLMADLNLSQQYTWFKENSDLIKPLEPLQDVNIDCIYSHNIPTPETLIFRNESDFPNGDYELVSGDGDGTVNLQSLSVCELWQRQLPEKVRQTIILNTDHLGVIGHKTTLTQITDDVMMN